MRTGLRKQRSTVTVEASPARRAETLDRVVIRFAGDSGDGMQLVGDRFTELSAPCSATTWRRCPNFPAEIRAPAGTIAGVSSFQVHISDHDIVDAGRRAERARRDEPGRAEGEPRATCRRASTLLVNVDAFDDAQPRQGRLRRRTRSTTARSPRSASTRCR